LGSVSKRARIVSYGSIVLVIIVAGLCRLLIGGFAVEVAALSVISVGLGAILLLVFYEVGLSEDKEREREEAAKRRRKPAHRAARTPMRPRRPG
jgi:archaellum biogenesis protein FlaJ (TadC family)